MEDKTFHVSCENWSLDPDLQIVHADVLLKIGGETLIDEPACVDVGLPALLLSALQDTEPNRWAPPGEWQRMPFFCCGCGDPECRAFSFRVRHEGNTIRLIELEERQNGHPKEMTEIGIPAGVYQACLLKIGKQFLSFIGSLDYRPYYEHTLQEIQRLVERLEQLVPGG